ncbi:phage tail protein [Xanthobacter versatilis]|uniref:hypothetical protein n=1 Tax=Xanthobacter autotrophicus (strain ATCC BAA-1158 / Py2) TaxID=78245 RepID=UPI003727437D
MPGRPGRIQSSFASGELADTLEARKDLKYYNSGLRQAVNCLVLPQGPLTLRPYFRQLGRRRRTLAAIATGSATITAPAGGTPANATDGNDATFVVSSSISGAGPHVLLNVDFHEPQAVSAIDVRLFSGPGSGRISVEYWDGAAWQVLNGDRTIRAAARSRRFCAPPASPVTANVWRVVVRNLVSAGSVQLAGVAVWSEGAAWGTARLRPFAYSREEAYDLVLMPGHGDVYAAGGGWITGFALPHQGDELALSRWRQQLNTGLIFHPTRRTTRIVREGSALEWQVGDAPFGDLPSHDFGDTDYTNGVVAVWDFQFVNFNATQHVFTITVDGEETDAIGPVASGVLEGPVKDAIEALPTIYPGVTAAAVGGKCRVTFTGVGNEGQVIVNSTRVLNAADAAVSWQRVEKGKEGGEPIFSDARGWPRCGLFWQQRLVVAGAPGTQNAFVGSVTGEYFNFSTEITTANGAFVAPIATEGGETIEEMVASRTLLIFTSEGEWWLSTPTLSKETAPAPLKASDHGIRPGVPVVESGDGAVFASKQGSALIEFRYNEVEQSFSSTRLSVLANHLVKDVVDIARKRATADTDANLVYFVQEDGAMRVVTLLREQEVTGFARIDTDGAFRAVCVNAINEVTVLTEREVAGAPVHFVERQEQGLFLDQAVSRTLVPAAAIVTGLADLEGAEVWVLADGEVFGPFTVAGGAITLPVPATAVTVGRWRPFLAETLPPNREVAPRLVTESEVGYHTVRLSLMATSAVAVGANGGEPVNVPLLDFGNDPTLPSTLRPFTGIRVVDGFSGASLDPTVVVTQLRPGPITLRSVVSEGDF